MVATMAYRLARGESLQRGVQRIADEELREGAVQLRSPGDPHARVHGARKAIKRTRAALRLLRAGLGPDFSAADRSLRDAARRLSQRRDAAVAVATFDGLVPAPTPELTRVRQALEVTRDAAAAIASEDDLLLAAAALEQVLAAIAGWSPAAPDWAVLRDGLEDSYAGGRRAMRDAFADPAPEAFHAWRKRAKDLWYHTLLLQGLWKPLQLATAAALEELSDLLGEDHDLEVLLQAVLALPDVAPPLRDALRDLADARSTELRTAAHTLGQRIYAERPRRYLARLHRYWETWRRPPPAPKDTPPPE